jgi:long-subunit fatty acid transport protein
MKVKRFLFSAFFVLMLHFSTPINAQNAAGSFLFSEMPATGKTPRLGMQAGTMFSTGLFGSSMFSRTLAPSINWDVSKRFSLELGTILSTTHMQGANALFPFSAHMAGGESIDVLGRQNLFSSTFYAAGAYQVNPRLTLVGSTWMERNNMADMGMNPMAFDINPRGAMFGFDYRVNENFSFGAEVSVSSGHNPLNPLYNHHPLYRSPANMLFHSPAPFHRGSRW